MWPVELLVPKSKDLPSLENSRRVHVGGMLDATSKGRMSNVEKGSMW